jgi:hypothetical protein
MATSKYYHYLYNTTMHLCVLRAFSPEFLSKRGIPMLPHQPYSPDLALVDFIIS